MAKVSGTAQSIWSIGDTGGSGNHITLFQNSSNQFQLGIDVGGFSFVNVGTTTVDRWHYALIRCASATNRRLTVLHHTGIISHGQDTTNKTPSGVDAMALGTAALPGGALPLSGVIGEFWYTNTDIQADGAQLQNSTLWTLAMFGPYALPHIAKDIVEYRKLRSCLDTRQDNPEEVYCRGLRQTWTNTNGVTLGPHPPAADNYYGPIPEQDTLVLV